MSIGYPFAVRLIGFGPQETEVFEATFAVEQGGHSYLPLHRDNLQDPDLYIVNATDLKALVTIDQLHPSDVRPALLIGEPLVPMPYARIDRPIRWHRLFDELDRLIERRADALSRLEASDIVAVSERRRNNRVDIDLTDPAEYAAMRARLARGGAILIVDRSAAFRDFAAETLARLNVVVIWAASEAEAEQVFAQHRVSAMIVNTTVTDIDPYRLCKAAKNDWSRDRVAVIFLSTRAGSMSEARASEAGYDGFLTKPVSANNLVIALRRFMQFSRASL